MDYLTRVDRWLTPEEAAFVWWNGNPRSEAQVEASKQHGRLKYKDGVMPKTAPTTDDLEIHHAVRDLFVYIDGSGRFYTDIAREANVSSVTLTQTKLGQRGAIQTIEKIANVVGYTLVLQPIDANQN